MRDIQTVNEVQAYHTVIFTFAIEMLRFGLQHHDKKIILAAFSTINAANSSAVPYTDKIAGKHLVKQAQEFLLGSNIKELLSINENQNSNSNETDSSSKPENSSNPGEQ